MERGVKWLLLVVVVSGLVWATLRWPHLDTVETGRTPEYPDLRPRDYPQGEEAVGRAAKAALDRLGWSLVGQGRGAGGTEVQAVARGGVLPLDHDVSVHIQRAGGRTRVSVRAHSRTGGWDFGENARLIEAFLSALDAEVGRAPGPPRRNE